MARIKRDPSVDRKTALGNQLEEASKVFTKHRDKETTDPTRRLAKKRLKRAQRRLGKLVTMEKKAADKAKKASAS